MSEQEWREALIEMKLASVSFQGVTGFDAYYVEWMDG